jgi:hypothetical protein
VTTALFNRHIGLPICHHLRLGNHTPGRSAEASPVILKLATPCAAIWPSALDQRFILSGFKLHHKTLQ